MSDTQQRRKLDYRKGALFLIIVGLPVTFLLFFASGDPSFQELPYLGPEQPELVGGQPSGEMVPYTYPDFVFTDHRGRRVTQADFEGKVLLVNILFNTCPSPSKCPVIFDNFTRDIYPKIADKPIYKDVVMLSHVIDPNDLDNPNVLDLVVEMDVNFDKWKFVAGKENPFYDVNLTDYQLDDFDDVKTPGGKAHYQMILLFDKEKHWRGVYKGMDHGDMKRLLNELWLLTKQYVD